MRLLDAQLTREAFVVMGETLARGGRSAPVTMVIAGGTAGLMAGLLRSTRATADCDVLWLGDEPTWRDIIAAAAEAAAQLTLPPAWLNRDCTMYAWCLPLGWLERCADVGCFGLLRVQRISRFDLIAAKLMGAPSRPHDLADLVDMQPTSSELDALETHLDRLQHEHLDNHEFIDQRAVIRSLRSRP